MKSTNRLTKTLLGAGLAVALGFALAAGNQALAQGSWETKASMPTARNSPHVVAIDGLLYVAGGEDGGGKTALESYDPSANSWTTLAPMPGRRYAGATGVIDGKLYVAGGWNAPVSFIKTNTLQIYDPGDNSWSFGLTLPSISASGAGGVIDRKLYVLGGFSNHFVVFDPDISAWTVKTSPPNFHAGPASGVIDGKLYVVGGVNPFGPTATLDVYDPGTDSWSTKAPMFTARTSPFGGVLDGKLYVAGGWDGSANLDTVEVYDPGTDSWATMTPMPTARNGVHGAIASPAIDGKLYMVGGHDGTSNLATLEVFTPGPDVEVAPTEFDFADVPTFTSEHTVVTIQNVGAVSHTVTGISIVGDPSFSESSTATPVVLTPGATEDVTVTYLPTSIGLKLATLTVTSDEGTVDVSFLGNGLEGMVEDQATVLETNVNDAIIAFTLVGSGSGKSANGRLGAFANMIEAAGDLIEAGFIEDACDQLRSALKRVDGEPRPPDFVSGTDAEFIEAEIIFLRDSLGCS